MRKNPGSEAAGRKPERRNALRYVEEVFEPRTKLEGFFSALLCLLFGVPFPAMAMATPLKSFLSSMSSEDSSPISKPFFEPPCRPHFFAADLPSLGLYNQLSKMWGAFRMDR